MVRRADKGTRFERWAIYFPAGRRTRSCKKCLGKVVAAGKAKVQMEDVSDARVDLVWPRAVTFDSAWRLCMQASQKDSNFEVLGQPQGIAAENESAAAASAAAGSAAAGAGSAALASAAPAAGMAPAEDHAHAADLAPAKKRQRRVRLSNKTSPARATGKRRTPAARALLPACLLTLKWEKILLLLKSDSFVENAPQTEVFWNKLLGKGSFGKVYLGRVRCTQQPVAVKMMKATDAEIELRRCVAVANHPHIINIVDLEFFRDREKKSHSGMDPHCIGLVYDLFETDLRQFLEGAPLEIAGARHVLRSVISALTYMHELGILHADLKPPNILMRTADDCSRIQWDRWLAFASGKGPASAESAEAAFHGCIGPRGCIFEVVVADLGSAELACPEDRERLKRPPGPRPADRVVDIGTAEYRPPTCSWAMKASVRPWTCGPSAAWPRK